MQDLLTPVFRASNRTQLYGRIERLTPDPRIGCPEPPSGARVLLVAFVLPNSDPPVHALAVRSASVRALPAGDAKFDRDPVAHYS